MKCAHPGCKCEVNNGTYGKYCSEHCQTAADTHEPNCQCGHPGCR